MDKGSLPNIVPQLLEALEYFELVVRQSNFNPDDWHLALEYLDVWIKSQLDGARYKRSTREL